MRALVVLFAVSLLVCPVLAPAAVFVSGPLPSEFSAGFILNKDTYEAQSKVAKEARKLMNGLAKCYSKGVKNVTKGKASGVDACLHHSKRGVITKYTAKTAPYDATTECLGGDATSMGASIAAFVKNLNFNHLYCVSASGAFIDPIDF